MAIPRTISKKAAKWTSLNPVLKVNDVGVELDTGNVKVGDGTTAWVGLGYDTGARGPSGAKGNKGDTGDTGPAGAAGIPLTAHTTVGRPAAGAAGNAYYDTTLGKPGFSDGTVWRDAAGNTI